MRALLLWLEAPLQSWGADSLYGRRGTLPFPTRSGVLGLLCCAAGRGGAQEAWLEEMKPFAQTVAAYARENDDGAAAVEPELRDFHMVGSGYDPDDKWQFLLVPKTSEGKRPVGPGTKMTYRYYLQDMAFACALEVPESLEAEIVASLKEPTWPVCLGRKTCVPTDLVYRGTFASCEEALQAAKAIAEGKKRKEIFRVLPGAREEGDVMTLNDVPVAFGLRKRYEDRQVTRVDLL